MKNLTELSLNHESLIWYFIIVAAIGGVFSYFNLGRMEDPKFTIREMVVAAYWPGASSQEIQEQVTDKLEKKLQDIPNLDYLESETRPGKTMIYVALNENPETSEIRPTWRDVRNYCNDIKDDLPEGVVGPFFEDTFDEVYGSIYAVTGDGYSYEELRRNAEMTRRFLLDIPDVKKVELVGEQTEKIYVEIERVKLAELGISPATISQTLAAQNSVTPAGMVETSSDNVYLRVAGNFYDVDEIKELAYPYRLIVTEDGIGYRLGYWDTSRECKSKLEVNNGGDIKQYLLSADCALGGIPVISLDKDEVILYKIGPKS